MRTLTFGGLPVVECSALPLAPTPAQDARRIVRHRLSHVLEKAGEPVGPRPGEATHAVIVNGSLHASERAVALIVGRFT